MNKIYNKTITIPPKTIQYNNKRCEVFQRVNNTKRGYLYLIKYPQGNTISLITVSHSQITDDQYNSNNKNNNKKGAYSNANKKLFNQV